MQDNIADMKLEGPPTPLLHHDSSFLLPRMMKDVEALECQVRTAGLRENTFLDQLESDY